MSEEDKELLAFVSVKQLARVYDDIARGLSATTIWEKLRQDLIHNKKQKEEERKQTEFAQRLRLEKLAQEEEHKQLELERARQAEAAIKAAEDALSSPEEEAATNWTANGTQVLEEGIAAAATQQQGEETPSATGEHGATCYFDELSQETVNHKSPGPLLEVCNSNSVPPELSSASRPGPFIEAVIEQGKFQGTQQTEDVEFAPVALVPTSDLTHASDDVLSKREPARSTVPANDDRVDPERSTVLSYAPLPAHKIESTTGQGERLLQVWHTKRYTQLLSAIQETEAQLCDLNAKLQSAAGTGFDVASLDADLQWHQSVFNHFIDLKKQLGKEEARILKRHPHAGSSGQEAPLRSLTTRVRALSQKIGGER
eukprot:TRINITY_DN5871_c0_g1_i2.p1 TRINITY_DN5871_c0_g1~~TRINITY_DN5871_c0_g1_i2.p1  ORF type:complete len:371 (-),score=72.89 TRINITY_DN5871_c0_g1_i2:20-1132(-)